MSTTACWLYLAGMLLLAGCGQKGALYLPDKNATVVTRAGEPCAPPATPATLPRRVQEDAPTRTRTRPPPGRRRGGTRAQVRTRPRSARVAALSGKTVIECARGHLRCSPRMPLNTARRSSVGFRSRP